MRVKARDKNGASNCPETKRRRLLCTLQGATFGIQFKSSAFWRFFAIFVIAFISGHTWQHSTRPVSSSDPNYLVKARSMDTTIQHLIYYRTLGRKRNCHERSRVKHVKQNSLTSGEHIQKKRVLHDSTGETLITMATDTYSFPYLKVLRCGHQGSEEKSGWYVNTLSGWDYMAM